jgi:Zn-dependent peptidase ImmA (M78 family)
MKSRDPEVAAGKAEFWLKQNGITSLPVDPFAIAELLDILVQPKNDTEPGVSGMLLRHGDNFGIMYATHIANEGFQRFSVAHELGHYLLEGHPETLFPNGDGMHASQAGFSSADFYEREADHFASGMLMPEHLFKAALRKENDGLGGIQALADKCKTSMTATAIRYAKLATIPAAVIISSGGRVDAAFLSKEMREQSTLVWPRKGDPLPSGVLTEAFVRDVANVRGGRTDAGEVELRDWLGGRSGVTATEEVIGLGAYGKVITVLTADFSDDDDEEDVEERWTPRFRG